jgi:hypothetical protein
MPVPKWIVVLVAMLALFPSTAQAQSAAVIAEVSTSASASWVVSRGNNVVRYRYINADKSIDPLGTTSTIADYGHVLCGISAEGKVIVASCKIDTRIVFLKPNDFTFDVLLTYAQLIIRENGRVHKVAWAVKEEATPTPDYVLHGDGRVTTAQATVRTGALAVGRLFGERFDTHKSHGVAKLSRSETVDVIVEPNARSYSRTVTHRSSSRRAAWEWIESFVASP